MPNTALQVSRSVHVTGTDAQEDRLPSLAFSIRPNSVDGFEAWRYAAAPMFDCELANEEQRKAFSVDVAAYNFGDMQLGVSSGTTYICRRDGAVIARSGTDRIIVHLYRSSDYVLTAGGQETVVTPGDVAFIDLSRPMVIRSDFSSNTSVVLERGLVEPLVDSLDDMHGTVLRKGAPLNALLVSHMRMLEREARRMSRADGEAVTPATAGLVAAALGTSSDGRDAASAATRTELALMIRREIEQGLGDRMLGPELLAARFGLSRAALYRLFEPLGGVGTYVRRRRLARAFHEVTSPRHFHERIGTIAYRWGFTDLTNFGRRFRQAYEMTPREARQAAREGRDLVAQRRDGATDAFGLLNRWTSSC